MYSRILVPTDGSKLSDKAITEAAQLAKLAGSSLLIIHVQRPYASWLQDEPMSNSLTSEVDQQLKAAARSKSDKLLEAAARLAAKESGVTTSTSVIEDSSPFDGIVKTAKKENCDLIVMASHGRGGLSAVLLGSETLKVLTHAPSPVLVVR